MSEHAPAVQTTPTSGQEVEAIAERADLPENEGIQTLTDNAEHLAHSYETLNNFEATATFTEVPAGSSEAYDNEPISTSIEGVQVTTDGAATPIDKAKEASSKKASRALSEGADCQRPVEVVAEGITEGHQAMSETRTPDICDSTMLNPAHFVASTRFPVAASIIWRLALFEDWRAVEKERRRLLKEAKELGIDEAELARHVWDEEREMVQRQQEKQIREEGVGDPGRIYYRSGCGRGRSLSC